VTGEEARYKSGTWELVDQRDKPLEGLVGRFTPVSLGLFPLTSRHRRECKGSLFF
jgi:hypothetical protein